MDFVDYVPSDPNDGVSQWAISINNQAKSARVPPCALAAIVSRESEGENILQTGVAPGPGCGVGLCQITYAVRWADLAHPTFFLDDNVYDLMDPSSNLYVCAKAFLLPAIVQCEVLRVLCPKTFAKFSPEILYFAFAVENAGYPAVRNALFLGEDPDAETTNDYASDTLARYHLYVAASHAAQKAA